MKHIQERYISNLSSRFRNFVKKSKNLYNFSCPYCGDSKANKSKARGYLLGNKHGYHYFCHNCSESCSFTQFMKKYDNTSYLNYVRDVFAEKMYDLMMEEIR